MAGPSKNRKASRKASDLLSLLLSRRMPSDPHPYQLCKLYIPRPDSKDQRWFIEYGVYSKLLGKIVPKKIYKINRYVDLVERKKVSKALMKELNRELRKGKILDDLPDPEEVEKAKEAEVKKRSRLQLRQVIKYGLNNKRTLIHFRDHEYIAKYFLLWLDQRNISDITVEQVDKALIREYARYMKSELKYSDRTIYNHISSLSGFVIEYNDDHEKAPIDNPFKIKKPEKGTGRNIAFTQDQQRKIMDFIGDKPEFQSMKIAIAFMFYLLARTNELSLLKIWMIRFKRDNQVHFPKDIVKGRKREKNPFIPPQLADIIDKSGIMNLPPDTHIFSHHFSPGINYCDGKRNAEYFRRQVLDPLGFPKEYTFYSWKHTGVVAAYYSGMSKAAIMQQAGWKNATSWENYLKSLGLYENDEVMTKFPTLAS